VMFTVCACGAVMVDSCSSRGGRLVQGVECAFVRQLDSLMYLYKTPLLDHQKINQTQSLFLGLSQAYLSQCFFVEIQSEVVLL
jgi:hypothetical protein